MAAGYHAIDDEKNLLIFDWGGGTFDVSVLCVSDGLIEVVATRGDMDLGGRDIDEILVDHCIKNFKAQTGIDIKDNKQARNRLMIECERAKITLSVDFET